MHGLFKANRRGGQRRRRHQIHHGQRRAAVQAITAARLWLGIPVATNTQAEAAEACGSTVSYLRAAALLVQSGDPNLIAGVEAGHMSLLQVAAQVKARVELITALHAATPQDRVAAARVVGPDEFLNIAMAAGAAA